MNLQDIEKYKIFECVSGSHAYGLNTPESDTDLRGVFMLPKDMHLGLDNIPDQVADKKNDIQFYELKKLFKLVSKCNPSLIELLFMPEDSIRVCHPIMKNLIENRDLFLSLNAYHTFSGYAFAQIRRAKGKNKWVNNPKPKEAPSKIDFTWVIPLCNPAMATVWDCRPPTSEKKMSILGFPMRPIPAREYEERLENCIVAKLEHTENVYRLYRGSKGVFRGSSEQLVTESISKEGEFLDICGLLIFNEQAYDRAHKEWKQYWEWRKNRNEARYRTQEAGEIDYDAKSVMHCIRILMSGKSILEGKGPLVRVNKEQRDFLLDIRRGRFSYEELLAKSEKLNAELDDLKESDALPYAIDQEKVNALYMRLINMEI